MKYIYYIAFVTLLVLGWTFGVQNAGALSYPLVFRLKLGLIGFESLPVPLGGALVGVFFLGTLLTLVAFLNHEMKMRRAVGQRISENRHLQTELNNLRHQIVGGEERGDDLRESKTLAQGA